MISVIVYGRNDNHGYNLHKRAAISLNAMAEVLTEPTDEILFVDYNTPDDFPTFVEAIADTLTPRAKERVRVLRARPAVHQLFAERAHLPVLEPIARNIALRRSNPANRWVLATNTDMIFVPRQPGTSLSDIAGDLPDGFYHLPRFELPETLWESLDRRDPKTIIARAEEWGQRFHLNDVVFGEDTILFDAPGDFQLVLREDLFGIDGFDEDMILGWHIDSNLAKRMTLLRGGIDSALPFLFGYHCDHTRQADALHGADRVENDWRRFVKYVKRPDLPDQRGRWGQPDAAIEEIDLREDASRRYAAALATAVRPMQAPVYESHYTSERYNDLHYVPEHVVPYIADQLSTVPRSANVLFAGTRLRFLSLFAQTWEALGFTGHILVPEEADGVAGSEVGRASLARGPAEVLIGEADLFLFEFGLASEDSGAEENGSGTTQAQLAPEDRDRLAAVQEVFLEAVAAEHARLARAGALPRRFVAVNVINNDFEKLIQNTLSFTYTPFSSRTRHGFAMPERPATVKRADPRALRTWLKTALGRSQIGPYQEISDLLTMLRSLAALPLDAALPPEAGALGAPLLALLGFPEITQVVPMSPAVQASLPDRISAARPSTRLAARLDIAVEPDAPMTGLHSGLPSINAWEDPEWLHHARRHFGGPNAYSVFERSRWLWQRISMLQALDQLGRLNKSSRVLVVVAVEEQLLGILPNVVGTVHAIGAGRSPEGFLRRAPEGLDPKGVFKGERLTFLESGREIEPGSYDAVIFPHGSALLDEMIGIPGLLRDAETALKPGGLLALMIDVALAPSRSVSQLSAALGSAEGLRAWVGEHTSFSPLGTFRDTISPETLDRTDEVRNPRLLLNSFVTTPDGALTTEALWLFEKDGETTPAGWDALSARFLDLALGSAWDRMRAIGEAARGDDGVLCPASAEGLFLYGPLMRLLAGAYRLTIDARAEAGAEPHEPVMSLEIAAAEQGAVLRENVTAAQLAAGPLTFEFVVPLRFGAGKGLGAHWEFRFLSLGGAALTVTGLQLAARDVATSGAKSPAESAGRSILADMRLTEIARREGDGVAVVPGSEPGCWLYGPYLPLLGGDYELVFHCAAEGAEPQAAEGDAAEAEQPVLGVEVVIGEARIGGLEDYTAPQLSAPVRLPFTVPSAEEGFLSEPVECRFWYRGRGVLRLDRLAIESGQASRSGSSQGASEHSA